MTVRKTPYYEQLYLHILRQLYTGQLRVGDALDSMETLCQRYAASPNTIRAVIRKLSGEGYIVTGRGRPTTVISAIGDREHAAERLRARRQEILEAFELLCILFPSIAVHSLRRLPPKEFQTLFDLLYRMDSQCTDGEAFRQDRSRFIHRLLSGSTNPLFLQISSQAEMSIMLPRMIFDVIGTGDASLAPERRRYAEYMRGALRAGQKARYDEADRMIYEAYSRNKEVVLSLIGPPGAEHTASRDSEYLYDRIVSDLLSRFYEGVYGPGDMLPSEASMCELYGVSIPTVKKAYRLLGGLGVVRTINGKGTRVTLFTELREGDPSLDRMKALSAFMEALEVVMVCTKDLAVYSAGRKSPRDADTAEQKLRRLWAGRRENQIHSIPVLLSDIVQWTGCGALNTLYQLIKKRLIWSIYLDRFLPDAQKEWESRHYFCLGALDEWRRGDIQRFGSLLQETLTRCYEQYRVCFDQQIRMLSA